MRKFIWEKVQQTIVAIIAIIGLIMASSDGPYFPWINVAGLLIDCVIVGCIAWAEERKRWVAHSRISYQSDLVEGSRGVSLRRNV
jgi:hypothetical protein